MAPEQQQLAADNHDLIFKFLRQKKLTDDEFYDIAAIGLCKATIVYNDKWKFSTIAYKCMSHEVGHERIYRRAKKRIPENEIVYLDAVISVDDDTKSSFEKLIGSKTDIEETVISDIYISEILSELAENEIKIVKLLLNGFTQEEIAKKFKLSRAEISRRKTRIAEKLRRNDLSTK